MWKGFKGKRFFLFGVLLLFAILVLVGCGDKPAQKSTDKPAGSTPAGNGQIGEVSNSKSGKQTELVMGTSSSGSSFQIIAIGMADLVSKQAGINTRAQSSGGSDATIQAIGAGKIDFGISSSPAIYSAFKGEGIYKDNRIPLVAIFGTSIAEPRQIVYRASSIKNPADFAGKKFMGKRSSIQDLTAFSNAFLEAYGVDTSKINMIDVTTTKEAIDALLAGTVDAATLPGGLGSAPIREVTEGADLRFVNFTEDKLKMILDKMGPAYTSTIIPKGTYKNQTEDILTAGVRTMLVSKEGVLTDESAYEITKVLWENPDKIKAIHSAALDWLSKDGKVPLLPIPYHEGSIKYFKEKGLWSSELQANQEKMQK